MDPNDQPNFKPDSSSPGSSTSDCNRNSSNPKFNISNENISVTPESGYFIDKDEPTTSNDKDGAKDSSQHLAVPSEKPRVPRSSSLKIVNSSAQGTSSDKKIVRFADALGLDLVDVKLFTNDGGVPNVPSRAFSNLKVSLSDENMPLSPQSNAKSHLTQDKYLLVPQFPQPGSDANFVNRVKDQKVCLENVLVFDLKVTGIVRISNLHYKKSVLVRYTTDNWNSEQEHQAKYIEGSSDIVTDKFTFTIHPQHMKPGDKLTFVVKYEVLGQVFWDNNNLNDYTLLCKEKNASPNLDSKGWLSVLQ